MTPKIAEAVKYFKPEFGNSQHINVAERIARLTKDMKANPTKDYSEEEKRILWQLRPHPMQKLYEHQQKIIDADPKHTGLFLGTGSGKTLTALLLARGKTLVICPKTQREDRNWEREAQKNKLSIDLTVMSKETFRRDAGTLKRFDTVIVDEAHTCLGVTPNTRQRKKVTIPRASQLFEALEAYLALHKPERLYLCTATIMRSPMTVWAAARLLGKDWDFYQFRQTFYVKLPMPGREVYSVKKDSETKDRLAAAVKKLGFVGRLEDYFDVPDQTYRTIHIELTDEQKRRIKDMKLEYPEPIVRVGKIHQIENGVLSGDEFSTPETFKTGKIDAILDLAEEFPRMVVFAKYTAQIEAIRAALDDAGYTTWILTGDTKDREGVIRQAGELDGVFIVQAQISAGWEVPHTPVMVFASRTYSFVDYDQAIGRIQRANNIKKNLYINLVSGDVDKSVDMCISQKQDFNERIYANETTK